jgi:hypothetical protein
MESGSSRTEEIMTQTQDSDAQRTVSKQSKTKTTIEFFREKFADEEVEPVWIDPKGNRAESESGGKV